MNILITHHRFHPNLEGLISGFILNGSSVILVCPINSEYSLLSEPVLNSLQIINLKSVSPADASSIFLKFKVNVLIQRHFENDFFNFGLVARSLNIPVIEYDQSADVGNNIFKQISRPLRRLINNRPLWKWTPVKYRNNNFLFKEPFSRFINLPVISNTFVKAPYIPGETIKILIVGKLGEGRKNHITALSCLDSLDFIEITIAGAGPNFSNSDHNYYKSLVKKINSVNYPIKVVQDLSLSEMANLYKTHDVLLFPAYGESLGFSILEAMSFGMCVITNSDVGAASYIKDKFNGFIIDSSNICECTFIISMIFKGMIDLNTIGNAAKEYIKLECDPKSQGKKIIDFCINYG